MSSGHSTTQSFIDELVRSTGASSPEEAIRAKARQLIQTCESMFGRPEMPIDVDVLTSLQGIHVSGDLPIQSPDAELAPRSEGGVEMRVHPDRPETRKRFSVAHEISHTFFPEYEQKSWCRTDARYRDRNDPDQYLEMLCDIGAAELLFPQPWFSDDANQVSNASGLVALADTYHGSREATLRRFAELSNDPIAAVFFTWKLKPVQKGVVDNEEQTNLFGLSHDEQVRDALQLRIDYSIASESFSQLGHYLPPEKSIKNDGPIFEASSTASCFDGECHLDFGPASGTYNVMAIPLPTDRNQRGPKGEHSVAAIVRPVAVQKAKKKRSATPDNSPTLFD
ncbi:hypothetical protein RMSM_02915 [Rhodopirellula maiorica SM1]|uniref:IrrE N-terminal-like domain-containing protein n=2 Tax=Novipirellula TaxID=2795426 RepID=M5RXN1_9BACT|nr:hypothetical protein RMSM_02915 [Rhodopirellula maiorica SM1]